jgi:hypothetical protein
MVNHDLTVFCVVEVSRGLPQRKSENSLSIARLRHAFRRLMFCSRADVGKE